MRVTQQPLLAVLLSTLVVAFAHAQVLPVAKPEAVGMSTKGLARTSTAIEELINDREIAGAVTMVARHGKVVYFEAQGMQDIASGIPMAKDTLFRIYSMTKAVVSVAAMILVEEGKLEIDAPASTYIPALGKMKFEGKQPEKAMTLRDLLRHTAGFPNNVSTDRSLREAGHPSLAESTLREMMDRLEVVPLQYEPGTDWHYSFATDVVARLVEIGSGQTLDAFLQTRIFEPLGMVDTAFYCPPKKWNRFAQVYGKGLKPQIGPQPGTSGPFTFQNAPKFLSGGGGFVSTAEDYMRFCLMLSGKGKFANKRLLTAETVEAMTRNQLPEGVGEISRSPTGRGFGLGFAVRIRAIEDDPSPLGEYEWLGGAGTEFFLAPSEELVVITLSQQMPMISLKNFVRPLIYDSLLDKNAAKTTPDRDRYLLLDSRMVAQVDNAQLVPGETVKSPHNPLLIEDQSWEPRFDNLYPNVIYDTEEQLYKCWYCPFIIDERTSTTPIEQRHPDATHYMSKTPNRREEALLYATSKDGIRWEKPALGIVEYEGNTNNNIVCRGLSGAGVIKDPREPDAERRYKAFYCADSGYKMRYSPDGLRWGSEVALPGVGESDCHANMIWSPALAKYIGIVRHYDPIPITGHRKIARTESSDAVTWAKSTTILTGTATDQLHDMTLFRDGGVYLGLIGCMNYPSNQSREGVRQHVELAWSPDSYQWHRISPGTPLIGPTETHEEPQYGKMPYDWGNSFAAQPIMRDGKIRIYYGASDWYFFDWRKGSLALATLRKDGWAGYEPIDPSKVASVTTTPLARRQGRLRLSADVEDGGSIRVHLIDGEKWIASEPITKTVTDGEVTWLNEFSMGQIVSDRFQLRFEIANAKLYSFSFAEPQS